MDDCGVVAASRMLDISAAGWSACVDRTGSLRNPQDSPSIQWSKLVLGACTQVETVAIGVGGSRAGWQVAPLLEALHSGRLKSVLIRECQDLGAAYKLCNSWTLSPTNLQHLESFGVTRATWGAPIDAS